MFACGKSGPRLLVESRLADRHFADSVIVTASAMPFGRQTFDRHGYGQQRVDYLICLRICCGDQNVCRQNGFRLRDAAPQIVACLRKTNLE